MSDDDIAQRTRDNMARLGIPKGTDDPLLLALGAEPFMIPVPKDRWERIAAVVRAAQVWRTGQGAWGAAQLHRTLDALTPDDIEAVQP